MLGSTGQASASTRSGVAGDEIVISDGEASGKEESPDRKQDTKTSVGHAPTVIPTMTNSSLPGTTMDASTVPTQRVINRPLPFYILNRMVPHFEVAHKIWQAGALSSDPCAICKALKIDCWVDGKYDRCARCTASPNYTGTCNAAGTKEAYDGLERTSSMGTSVKGGEHRPAIDYESSGVESTSKNKQRPPQGSLSSRSLPEYIQWPTDKEIHKIAYNLWKASKLSSSPCQICTRFKAEC